MANSITAELSALREEVAALRGSIEELLEIVRPVDLELVQEGEAEPDQTEEEPEETGVKFVDGQLVDVPKGKGK